MIRIRNLSYRYPGRPDNSLDGINLSIEDGDFVVLKGLSGSGKTTLLRSIDGIVPFFHGGSISGTVEVDGMTTRHETERVRRRVGLLFQDPENQVVMSSVRHEIAFGMENLGFERGEILRRIEDWAEALNISHLMDRRTAELSGGEKQKIALASILAPGPRHILLDEPTSQLDSDARKEFMKIIKKLNTEGSTVVISSHDDIREGRKVFMRNGSIAGNEEIKEGAEDPLPNLAGEAVLMSVSRLSAEYQQAGSGRILENIDLELHAGEVIGLVGKNGSGKSTLLRAIMGLPRVKTEGKIGIATGEVDMMHMEGLSAAERAKRIAYLGQYPGAYLFHDTLEEEIGFTLKNMGIGGGEERIASILEKLSLSGYGHRNPRDLSSGEKERAALATVLVSEQRIILLDEPTRGMDPVRRGALVRYLGEELMAGKGVIVATHDMELLRLLSANIYELSGGELLQRGRYHG